MRPISWLMLAWSVACLGAILYVERNQLVSEPNHHTTAVGLIFAAWFLVLAIYAAIWWLRRRRTAVWISGPRTADDDPSDLHMKLR